MQESEVEHARPPQRWVMRGVLRRGVAKVRVNEAYASLRQRRLEVMDEVDKDKAPSNVLEEPRRRARKNVRDRTRGGRCAGRCAAAQKKVRVDKVHVLARHRRLEVVDEVNKDEAPSNVLEEPRRRAR